MKYLAILALGFALGFIAAVFGGAIVTSARPREYRRLYDPALRRLGCPQGSHLSWDDFDGKTEYACLPN